MEKITRKAASSSLIQTAKQILDQGARMAVATRYAPRLGYREAKGAGWIDNKDRKTGLEYGMIDQYVVVNFKGRAIPIVAFNPTEKKDGWHPKYGQLWSTHITMYGRRVKTGAFHLRGNNRATSKNHNASSARENLQRGGWGNNPGEFTRNSKLFYRKTKNSTPIERFITHSVGSLMAEHNLHISLESIGERYVELNFQIEFNRRISAAFRGYS